MFLIFYIANLATQVFRDIGIWSFYCTHRKLSVLFAPKNKISFTPPPLKYLWKWNKQYSPKTRVEWENMFSFSCCCVFSPSCDRHTLISRFVGPLALDDDPTNNHADDDHHQHHEDRDDDQTQVLFTLGRRGVVTQSAEALCTCWCNDCRCRSAVISQSSSALRVLTKRLVIWIKQ